MLGSLGEKKKDRIFNNDRNIKPWPKKKKLLLLTFDPYIPYDEIYLEYHADLMPKPSHTYILGFKGTCPTALMTRDPSRWAVAPFPSPAPRSAAGSILTAGSATITEGFMKCFSFLFRFGGTVKQTFDGPPVGNTRWAFPQPGDCGRC